MIKKLITGVMCAFTLLFIILFTYTPSKHENHGKLDLKLFLGDSINQPLIVGFGGGEGGNAWTSDYWKNTRDAFLEKGYAFLAVGYFGSESTPTYLDRISLNAIYDSIINTSYHPMIDGSRIALIGGSKGAELALNLSSRFDDISAVVALVPSHVSFPALTPFSNTSSWEYNGKEVRFTEAPFKVIVPALQGNHLEAFSIMLEDENEVMNSTIKVENINGSILLVSATKDEMWPSTYMSEQIMIRLERNKFKHKYEHVAIGGSHSEPLNHFDKIFDFLESNFK